MASGPTIMAAIGMDATNFNAAVANVTQRTNAMAAQMSKAGFSKAGIDAAVAAEKFSGMRGELTKMGMNPAAATAALRAQELEASNNKAAKSTSVLGTAMKTAGAMMAVDFLRGQAAEIIEYADKVGGLSSRLGMSAEAVQQWDHALKLSNSSIDAAVPFFERLAAAKKNALEGDGKTIASFAKFGVGLGDLKDMRLEDVALRIGQAFQGGDPQKLIADLRLLGGKGAGQMVEAFSDGLAAMIENNRNSWAIMSNDAVANIKTAKDEFDKLKMLAQGVGGAVIGEASGQILAKLEFFSRMFGAARGGLEGMFDGVLGGKETVLEGIKRGLKGEDEKAKKKGVKIADDDDSLVPAKGTFGKLLEAHQKKQAKDEERRAKDAIKEDARGKLDTLRDEMAIAKTAARGHSVNSLQSGMGGFLGNFRAAAAPETAVQNAQLKTMEKMERHLAKLAQSGTVTATPQEEF
jgi:hypothetical protein